MRKKNSMQKLMVSLLSVTMAASVLPGVFPETGAMQTVSAAGKEVVHYDMSIQDGVLKNLSGSGMNGGLNGITEADVNSFDGVNTLTLDGNGSVSLPAGMVEDNTMTVSVTAATTQANNQWLWTFGKDSWDYSFFTPSNSSKKTKFSVASQEPYNSTGAWAKEKSILTDAKGLDGNYHTYTVVYNETKTQMYIDGELAGEGENPYTLTDIVPADGTIGYIGKSLYSGDPLFKGQVADFRVMDDALTAEEVKNAQPEAADYAGMIKADALKIMLNGNQSADAVTSNVVFPEKVDGTAVTWTSSDESVIAADGKVTAPVAGSRQVTVTAKFTYAGQAYQAEYTLTVKAEKGIVAEYDMTAKDGKLVDVTKHGFDASYVGFTADDFTKDGSNTILNFKGDKSKYVNLPKGIVTGEEFTIETKFSTQTKADHWLWCLGTKVDEWPNVTNYVFLNPMQTGGTIRTGLKDAKNEQLMKVNGKIDSAKKYNTATAVFTEGTYKLYINGKLAGTLEHGYKIQDIIENGASEDIIGYIGKSTYKPDPVFTGKLAGFKVYNYALTEAEINDASDEKMLAEAMEEIEIPNKDDIRGNITLPSKTSNGAAVTWKTDNAGIVDVNEKENKDYDNTPAGVITRPDKDTKVTMTATVTYGTESAEKVIEITVKAKPEELKQSDYKGYLFASFTGESATGEQIYFSTSKNGLRWTDVNDGTPVLTSTLGEKGVRDPFIMRSEEGDKFYLIATDLRIANGAGWGAAQYSGSHSLMIWESTDLVNWSEQRMVEVAVDNAGCTWAPEFIYDEKTGEYMVFWASMVDGKQRIYYAKTRDFYTFTEPTQYIERDTHVIDTTIVKEGDIYYRISKDETTKNVKMDKGTNLLGSDSDFTAVKAPELEKLGGVEGPTAFKFNDDGSKYANQWCVMVDQYGSGKGYLPMVTKDLASGDFKILDSSEYSMGNKKRHGSVINLTQEEYDAVMQKWGDIAEENTEEESEEPILTYDFESVDGTSVNDTAVGNAAKENGTMYGKAAIAKDDTLESNVLKLDGTNGSYLEFPKGFFDGRNKMTISMDVKSEKASGNFFTFTYGKNSTKYNFLRVRGNDVRNAITTGSWGAENEVKTSKGADVGTWQNVTIVVDDTNMKLYVDGHLMSENKNTTILTTELGKNLKAYLGKSFYDDPYFQGSFDNVKVYNRALSEMEIAKTEGVEIAGIKSVDAKGYTFITNKVDVESKVVELNVSRNNSEVKTLKKVPLEFVLADGAKLKDTEKNWDLSKEQKVTIVLSDGTEQEWTVKAQLCNNPVLGGQYADPDIDVFDGKFYIYPTTDGFSGWSGTQFHVFSSEDMIDWKDEGVIVDVADKNPGVNENGVQIASVPWAVGSAWAPTIEEKDGVYYYYFCAKEADGRSAIGVATSDSPVGPFVAEEQPLVTMDTCKEEGIKMGQTIDPSIYTEDDGTSYMLFGNGQPAIVQLGEDMKSIVPGTMKNYEGANGFREAITVTKRDGIYHFTWSNDDTGSENYSVHYGTSDSLYGPITYQYPVLQKDVSNDILGTGHHSIVKVPDKDEYYIAYHRFVTPLGQFGNDGRGFHRETCIDKLTFDPETGLMNTITPTLLGITDPVNLGKDDTENPGENPGDGDGNQDGNGSQGGDNSGNGGNDGNNNSGNNEQNGNNNNSKNPDKGVTDHVKTGDAAPVAILIIALGVAFGSIVVIIRQKRQRQR